VISQKTLFRNHEWFRINLPAYLFPPVSEGDASIIDVEAIRDVSHVSSFNIRHFNFNFQRFNVPEEDVTAALLGDDPHDKLSVAYNLIVDNKRIADESKYSFLFPQN
jgi:5'-AMP-activated protein kinase catalytic alpha subunit